MIIFEPFIEVNVVFYNCYLSSNLQIKICQKKNIICSIQITVVYFFLIKGMLYKIYFLLQSVNKKKNV